MFWDFSISEQFPRHVDVSSEFKCNLYCRYDDNDGVMTMTMMMMMVMMVVIMMMMVMMEMKICDAVELRQDT